MGKVGSIAPIAAVMLQRLCCGAKRNSIWAESGLRVSNLFCRFASKKLNSRY